MKRFRQEPPAGHEKSPEHNDPIYSPSWRPGLSDNGDRQFSQSSEEELSPRQHFGEPAMKRPKLGDSRGAVTYR